MHHPVQCTACLPVCLLWHLSSLMMGRCDTAECRMYLLFASCCAEPLTRRSYLFSFLLSNHKHLVCAHSDYCLLAVPVHSSSPSSLPPLHPNGTHHNLDRDRRPEPGDRSTLVEATKVDPHELIHSHCVCILYLTGFYPSIWTMSHRSRSRPGWYDST